MLPSTGHGIASDGGLPGLNIWATLDVPILLIGGENDQVTKPEEVVKICKILQESFENEPLKAADGRPQRTRSNTKGSIERISTPTDGVCYGEEEMGSTWAHDHGSRKVSATEDTFGTTFYSKNDRVVRTKILQAPASHALLYDPVTYRTVAGHIQPFLADYIDRRLSIGWQLTYLSTEGKWDVKNLEKWSDVKPVSDLIAGIFRAMKTLRQIDENHSPKQFLQDWGGKIRVVIDISHDSPVYDPKEFEEGGIEYYKLPTVSKIPPTPEETQEFIELVDRLRTGHNLGLGADDTAIGVHCHYGFNRTGFFICAYLIEREGYSTEQATEEFRKRRPDGIKHEHFINTLFARYPHV